jgi:hypothetical protein
MCLLSLPVMHATTLTPKHAIELTQHKHEVMRGSASYKGLPQG